VNRSGILCAVALLGLGVYAGCTQDFDQFEPHAGTGGAGATSTGSGLGGAATGGGGAFTTSTTSSSTSTSTTSTTTTTSTTSTTSTGAQEDCTNGTDDDGDGDPDCADTDCGAGFACVDPAPANWQGPVVLFDGPSDMAPAACPGDYPNKAYQGGNGLVAEPAQCSACTCDAPQVDCVLKVVTGYSDNQCTNASGNVLSQGAPDQCTSASVSGVVGAKADAPSAVPGPCTASTEQPTLPPPNWTDAGFACGGATAGGGCANNAACLAKPAAPFGQLCVFRSGDHSCPSGYGDKHTFVDDVVDTRDCTSCSCGTPDGTCTASTAFYSNPNCNTKLGDLPNDGACHAASGTAKSMKTTVTATGSCPPSGGDPIGSIVEGASKTTVCCTP
jgi:hypothetical protein